MYTEQNCRLAYKLEKLLNGTTTADKLNTGNHRLANKYMCILEENSKMSPSDKEIFEETVDELIRLTAKMNCLGRYLKFSLMQIKKTDIQNIYESRLYTEVKGKMHEGMSQTLEGEMASYMKELINNFEYKGTLYISLDDTNSEKLVITDKMKALGNQLTELNPSLGTGLDDMYYSLDLTRVSLNTIMAVSLAIIVAYDTSKVLKFDLSPEQSLFVARLALHSRRDNVLYSYYDGMKHQCSIGKDYVAIGMTTTFISLIDSSIATILQLESIIIANNKDIKYLKEAFDQLNELKELCNKNRDQNITQMIKQGKITHSSLQYIFKKAENVMNLIDKIDNTLKEKTKELSMKGD
jgi:hypothetical protein